jgi:hypothetical protein
VQAYPLPSPHHPPNNPENKTAYISINNRGFKVKDIIWTEVDIQKGMIQWKVNSIIVAEYYSDDIKFEGMVPFISLLDFYDEAVFLDQ